MAIPIVCGPTASGKSSVALELANKYPLEIISADSRQIIKYLNIGTAKPTPDETKKAPVHLIDIIEPGTKYSAFQFILDANRMIKNILQRDKIPILVGGTGLYLRSLTDGVVEIEQDNLSVREKLEQEMEEIGLEKMYEKLENIDPLEAAQIHPNNKHRVIRALEIYYITGKTKSELVIIGAYQKSEYDFKYFCLAPERQELYDIINNRVDEMLEMGWLDELQALLNKEMGEKIIKANVIGYKELISHLEGKLSLEEAVLLIKQNTRRYAKRQMTWFRKQEGITFYSDKPSIINAVDNHIEKDFQQG